MTTLDTKQMSDLEIIEFIRSAKSLGYSYAAISRKLFNECNVVISGTSIERKIK